MRLFEIFITETTEEDRALISLSSELYDIVASAVAKNKSDNLIELGTISSIVDTPMEWLHTVKIDIQQGAEFFKRLDSDEDMDSSGKQKVLAFWSPDEDTVVINKQYVDIPRMKTIISHELRHALDDYKSSFKAGDSVGYFSPRKHFNKISHSADSSATSAHTQYLAQRGEIQARFVEAMHTMVNVIRRRYENPHVSAAELIPTLKNDLAHIFDKYQIASLFPEKYKSKDYKRLVTRAMDMITKEMSYIETHMAQKGKPKKAEGKW